MRVLFATWAWPTHFYPMVPLAWAFRAAGHEVVVASQPSLMPVIRGCGLTGVAIGADEDIAAALGRLQRQDMNDRRPRTESRTVARYAEMAGAMAAPLARLIESWSPGLVVYEETTYAAPLVAEVAGVPSVRHLWGVDVMSYIRWSEPISLASLVSRLGASSADGSRIATVDPCPAPLQVPAEYPRTAMRYVPYNGTGEVPRWLAGRGDRPRVCVTYGRTLATVEKAAFVTGAIVEAVGDLDVEAVAAITRTDRDRIGAMPDNVRVVENLPLASFVGGCDLIVSHGGPGTVLTAAALGVRQLSVPQIGDQILLADLTAQQGCGACVPVADATPDRLRAEVTALLSDRDAAAAATVLAAENAGRPSPVSVASGLVAAAERYTSPAPHADSTRPPAAGGTLPDVPHDAPGSMPTGGRNP